MGKNLSTLALAALAASAAAEVIVRPPEKTIPYGPIPAVAPVGMSLADGMMLKEGRPHFWIGQGDGPGAYQQGPAGLWLAWLQGADATTLRNGMWTSVTTNEAGVATVAVDTDIGMQSWRREAVRLGMLTDFFHGGDYSAQGPSHSAVQSNAELAEAMCPYGHFLSVDSGHPLGRQINVAKRKAVSDYLMAEPDTGYMELCREPGPDPRNRRACEVFRAFAKRKYGTLAEADAVWGTRHESWEDVLPPHLDDRLKHESGSSAGVRRRRFVRGRYRAFYRDWVEAIQGDVTAWVKGEIDALHAVAPGIAFAIDVRGHTDERFDAYPMLVPEEIDRVEDLFLLHQGTHSFAYGNRPYDAESVVHAASFPLFNMNYFRVNARGALVNAEDIISSAKAPASDVARMKANCLGQITDSDWDFRTDPDDRGLAERWFAPKAGAAGWGTVHVPGAWDLQAAGRGYSGVAWYRRTFRVDGSFRQDHEDGSRIFRLRGKGVAQEGTAWLNGVKLGDAKGWDTPYAFDVGALLNYGGENTLVWQIDGKGKSENGLRFDTYLLPDDLMSREEPFDERQFRRMAFNQLFEGLSGVFVWHWHDDAVRPYQPELRAQLQTVAEPFLPYIRHRRGRVAYLYSYDNQPGLPKQAEGTYRGFGDLQCALDFLGHKPDIFGERAFREEVTPERYPILFAPRLPTVEDATYAHFRRYVRAGGVAVITEGSLAETSSRYAPTDIATFDRGAGRVVVLPEPLELDRLMDELPALLPPPEVGVEARDAGAPKERPLVERVLAGPEDHKVLYLCNWGGMDHTLDVTLPEGLAGWNVTEVVGAFRRGADGRLFVRVPSQDVAVAILDRPGRGRTAAKRPSPHRMAKIGELQALMAEAAPAESCDVLFLRWSRPRGGFRMGPELFPDWLRAVKALGLTYGWSDPSTWTAETLKGKRLVVLTESLSNAFFKYDFTPELKAALVEYVRGGGALLLATSQTGTTNVNGLLLAWPDRLGGAFGIVRDRTCEFVEGGAHTAFGDPFQHLCPADAGAEGLTDGVGEVLVNITAALSFPKIKGTPSPAFPVVRAPDDAETGAGRPVMAAARLGAGRVFACGDITAFVPFRIGHADNAALLLNAFGWLADRPVSAAAREAFARSPFLTEADAWRIHEEERGGYHSMNDIPKSGTSIPGDFAESPRIAGTPCLQAPGETSMGVSWAVSGLSKGVVEIADNPALENARIVKGSRGGGLVPVDDAALQVRITGLKPATRYWYRTVTTPFTSFEAPRLATLGEPVASAVHSFATPGPAARGHFCAINDTHASWPAYRLVCRTLKSLAPEAVVWNGDAPDSSLQSKRQAAEAFLDPPVEDADWAADIPAFFVRGNHDVRGSWASRLGEVVLPRDPAERRGDQWDLPWNFAVRLGDLALVGLDAGEDKPDAHVSLRTLGLAAFEPYRRWQTEWLAEALARPDIASAPFKVVFCHIPLFAAPDHPDYPNDGVAADHGAADWSRECAQLWGPLITAAGVQLVVSGHTHCFRYDPPTPDRPWAQVVGGGPRMGIIRGKPNDRLFPTVVEGKVEDGNLRLVVHDLLHDRVILDERFKPMCNGVSNAKS